MHALLLSGLGATYKNSNYFGESSLFRKAPDNKVRSILARAGVPALNLSELTFADGGRRSPLLRPPGVAPHLTTFTLESILQMSKHPYTRIPLEDIWNGLDVAPPPDIDVVLLSTTYIWNRRMLSQVMEWIRTKCPGVPVVTGGQYTNLKFMMIMAEYPEISAVVRGDAEIALPRLLDEMAGSRDFATVPNLVWRDGDRPRINPVEYVDLDAFPSPSFPHHFRIAPYESMRGCPFDCKFCSFPAASPKWRYKSAQKIKDDWLRYAGENGVSQIEAMDSTFTVPPTRLRELMRILPGSDVPEWSCFTRANSIKNAEFIEGLVESRCTHLEIGFESMSEATLKRMSKRVTAKQNRQAFELLNAGDIGYGVCFMVGYPGEDEAQFEDTRRFLIDEYAGRFALHLFSVSDETMPLWEDREELQITVEDPYDPDSAWSHRGMTSADAKQLQLETLDEIRRKNDHAVVSLWQREYERPLLPTADRKGNLVMEKALERLAMVPRDFTDIDAAADNVRHQLDVLHGLGVEFSAPTTDGPSGAGDPE
ncbi:radical SAM protein [Nocardia terpenica]|uniref:B12-binding domain-containing radical SAM protein n=1 Tax=Nocardia terpenica TaxID=455432 RepID=UPI0018930A63|nr:radical SAM protein [Nocardia terpenica]MBF6063307.1 radical SAM protein [Nocardia terpenica]MBF6105863.1 radical SAM protein [Nocardia terpenica]MBF6113553.1 radical SAM protein [Nocardia terpenica]MBF6119604.1 radical SAM protein [Nocardia terpenica]MBF6152015.1 radical SAM protein [Nocardia terpenica]